jgi:hypothetical protein
VKCIRLGHTRLKTAAIRTDVQELMREMTLDV